jgi:hypothetical protein
MIGRLVLEGLVIVVSILLAFSLDTWWNARNERVEEIAVLENLRAEFSAAGDQLDAYISLHRRIADAASATLASVQEALANGESSVPVPDTALAIIFVPPTFDPRLGTLDGLLASGRLGILGDPELRRSLAGWPGLLAEGTEEEEKVLQYVLNHLGPVLRTRTDLSRALSLQSDSLVDGTMSRLTASRTTRLDVDAEVSSVLATRLRLELHAIEDLEPARAEIDYMVRLVEGSLE